MRFDFIPLVIASSLAMGFGFGYGLAASGQPFVLEAHNTPIGSFTLRGNFASVEPYILPDDLA